MAMAMKLVLLFALVALAVAGPARKIYELKSLGYAKQSDGTTKLYYRQLGIVGTVYTEFNGGKVRCSEYQRLVRPDRIIYGFIMQCTLPYQNGIFTARVLGGKGLQGIDYFRQAVN